MWVVHKKKNIIVEKFYPNYDIFTLWIQVLDTTRHLPGMAGIFLAGIVSSALSAMSAGINTLSGLLYDDFIDQYIPESPNKQAKAANIMKVLTNFLFYYFN